ncbi:MAG: prephenate dehydratase [Desulfobacteraceae bacterium]|nr:MAG: prephenate dehydratase [Desulfobacteraceae bacterium]
MAENNDSLKGSIQSIDDEILKLVNKRLAVSEQLGLQQQADDNADMNLLAEEEKEILRLSGKNTGPLDQNRLRLLFQEIFSLSIEVSRRRKISYLGPEATFTHIAAMSHFGRSASYIPQLSIRDVFIEVEKKRCDFGVVPVENSIEGSVNYTLDLFFESSMKICAEKYQTISHDLLSRTGRLEDIKVVYSHPQPIAQCRGWLRKNLPNARLEECSSTSFAAQKVGDMYHAAAIASSEAARIYNLQVVASRIEDHSNNTTRFLVIGKKEMPPTGNDKTSLMFAAAHVPGSLYKSLAPIAEAQLNMMKLESRPSKHENWSYFFFVDLEGHLEDQKVQETIAKMKEQCLFLKVLGSYPKSAGV